MKAAPMTRLIVFVYTAFLASTIACGQASDESMQRCEKILIDSINEADRKALDAWTLAHARLVPVEAVRDVLVQGLGAEDSQVRFVAANVLAEKSPLEFGDRIIGSLNAMTLQNSTEKVQRAVLLMKLGDEKAKHEVSHWAEHQFYKLDLGDWVCPMMCVLPEQDAGKCPVCRMHLVKHTRTPNQNDWEAKLSALRALRAEGNKVAEQARSIVVSNAPAFVRVQAAGLWAEEDLHKALPHIKIFMKSSNRYSAVALLADLAPKQSVVEFRKIIDDARQDDEITLLAAHRGLLRAGETAHLVEIRKWVEQSAKQTVDNSNKINGIYLLGELGLNEDIPRLEKLLGTKFEVAAASTLLRKFARSTQSTNK